MTVNWINDHLKYIFKSTVHKQVKSYSIGRNLYAIGQNSPNLLLRDNLLCLHPWMSSRWVLVHLSEVCWKNHIKIFILSHSMSLASIVFGARPLKANASYKRICTVDQIGSTSFCQLYSSINLFNIANLMVKWNYIYKFWKQKKINISKYRPISFWNHKQL